MDILGLFGFSFQGLWISLISSILDLILNLVAGLLGVEPIA